MDGWIQDGYRETRAIILQWSDTFIPIRTEDPASHTKKLKADNMTSEMCKEVHYTHL